MCASNLGNYFATIWDVSNDAMRRHDYEGLWKITVFTSILALLPLSLLFLLPQNAEEQIELSKSKVKSKYGGFMFLLVLLLSLIWTMTTAISNVLKTK